MRSWIPLLVLLAPAAVAGALEAAAPWWAVGLLLPALLWAPGYGFACLLERPARLGDPECTGLQRFLDAAWAGMALTWLDVAIVREAGFRGEEAASWLVGLAALWTAVGMALSWRRRHFRHTPPRERLAAGLVVLAVFGIFAWKNADLQRPLDGHWYLDGADNEGHQPLPLRAGLGWASSEPLSWPEAGAMRLVPSQERPTLVAEDRAYGRLIVAVRGPVGSWISLGDKRAVVEPEMTETAAEGPVRRYLDRGVAAVSAHVELEPGEAMAIGVQGEEVYLIPGTDAVWALHAAGELRYTHYYQLLNLVENQVWAEEMLEDRRFTWNQPPGWSPLLSTAVLLVQPDLPGANALFLWVLLLVGLSGARLASLLAPGASWSAWLAPAGMVLGHGLLMIEPGSTNFPDNLYAAALVGVGIALASRRTGWFAGMGAAAGALRWPGVITAALLALLWRIFRRQPVGRALAGLGVALALGLAVAIGAALSGDAEDLLFILYFETFPEHWHGEHDPSALLSRVPEFYGKWLRYTGGGPLLALPMVLGPATPERQGLRFLLAGAFAYSLLLCTIDHHPSHYFLPLVAYTGPALAVAASTLRRPAARHGLLALWALGMLWFLASGEV